MRKVVDSNFLRSRALRDYLSKSPKNFVVVTDYASMEVYKTNSIASICRSMEILAQYPKQVIVLKGTLVVCGLKGRRAGLQRRLIDEQQTQEFPEFCQHLVTVQQGNLSIQRQLLEHGRTAAANINRIQADAASLSNTITEIAKDFTDTEIRVLRKGSPLTKEMADKFIRNVLFVAGYMFKDHPRFTKFPKAEELPNTFIFRAALCAYLLSLRWISDGGAQSAKPAKMRNDIVDVSFAAYATFFDGVLTKDKKLKDIYEQAAFILPIIYNMAKH